MSESIPLNTKYKAKKEDLISIVGKYQDRQFAEDIELIESGGGEGVLLENLGTNHKTGITASSIPDRVQAYGSNERKQVAPRTYLENLKDALEDFTLRILILAATVSIVIHMITEEDKSIAWVDGSAILVAVIVVSNVTAYMDYKKDKQFRILNDVANERKTVNVIRDGIVSEIHQDRLVVGDVVKIFEGMDIPADGILIEGYEISTDESAMTGEPDPIKKAILQQCLDKRDKVIKENSRNTSNHHSVPSPLMLSGTKVMNGEGKFVITVVGQDSCVGKIFYLVTAEDAEVTPLQQKLETIARDIGKLGLIAAILTVSVLIIRFIVDRSIEGKFEGHHLGELLEYLIIGITIVVVAIPEGLPLAVTLSLAFSVKKMVKDKNLVRKMQACETMGGADCICSDKTGTLTQNKMYLTNIWNNKLMTVETSSGGTGGVSKYCPEAAKDFLIQSIACNSSASLVPETGSKTEIALLQFLQKHEVDSEKVKAHHLTDGFLKFPFSSERKRMSTILENVNNSKASRKRMHIKGASEIVLESCSYFYDWEKNTVIPISAEFKQTMYKVIEEMAGNALRTICVAYKEIEGNEDVTTQDKQHVFEIEKQDFTLIALFGIRDILRESVPSAVEKCKKAGIKVRMVTGDNKITARAIAKECKIHDPTNPASLVMEGAEFIEKVGGIVCKKCRTKICACPRDRETAKRLKIEIREDTIGNPEEFDRLYPNLDVLARSRPEDKYALVLGLLERNHVVAVTGDGTNDAPALKKADVGFAMGIAGTEVAREAASIILLDDNFASIVRAVIWGRNIYDSIKKFLQFQLTVNIVAVVSTFIGASVLKEAVLKPIQMLWVNLIMDTAASLALSTEPPSDALLDRKPHNRLEYIINKKMFKHIIGQAIYQLIIMMAFVFAGEKFLPEYPTSPAILLKDGMIISGRGKMIDTPDDDYDRFEKAYGPSRHYTYVFNVFVMMQIGNFLNARKLQDELYVFEGLSKASYFWFIIGLIIAGQVLIVHVGYRAFHVAKDGLTIEQWLICTGFGLGSLIVSLFLKFIPEDKLCPSAGNKMTDPIRDRSGVMGVKRSSNEPKIARKFSSIIGGNKPSSLSRIASHNNNPNA